ncbi:MAG TPA: tetratricopeptide repeat protein, partial [Phycisphaerae bacterium]|nr:tetratricopeptide repeat protein [Phycisphaerae bacterium]
PYTGDWSIRGTGLTCRFPDGTVFTGDYTSVPGRAPRVKVEADRTKTRPGAGIAVEFPLPASASSTRPAAASGRPVAVSARDVQAMFRAGNYAAAKAHLQDLLKHLPQSSYVWYNLACAQSRVGELDDAVASLESAVGRGFLSFDYMQRDPDLEPLRDHPGFRSLLSRRDELQRQAADRMLAALRRQYGNDCLLDISHEDKVIFATSVSRPKLVQLKAFLSDYAKAQWKHLFTHKLDRYVTVIIPKPDQLRSAKYLGFYSRWSRTLVARNIDPTVRHEFTHALHYADQEALAQNHPTWIVEGLATLFEYSRVVKGQAQPSAASRWTVFRKGLLRQHLPLDRLTRLGRAEFLRQASVTYPQSYYVMLYLHQRKALKSWYDAYTAAYAKDPTGLSAMEKVLGSKAEDIQTDWVKWLGANPRPAR